MLRLLVLVCLLFSFVAVLPSTPRAVDAATCTKILTPDPHERIASGLDFSPVIAIGVVTWERLTADPAQDDYSREFESTVRIVEVLFGDLPEQEITIPYLNQDCPGGGARLRVEEDVLMVLHRNCYASHFGVQEDCHWAMWDGGKILLKPGQAILEDVNSPPVRVGEPRALIRDIGERVGASEQQIEAAVLAAPARKSEAMPWLPEVAALAIIVFTIAVATGRLSRSKRRR